MNQNSAGTSPALQLTIEGKPYSWSEQFICGRQIREAGGLSSAAEIFLAVKSPWKDESIGDDDRVDLARPEIEHFYVKKKLLLTVNGKEFESDRQFIQGATLRRLAGISEADDIFLSIAGPWEDELVKDDAFVDLARPGIEHFYSKEVAFDLIVNAKEDKWKKHKISYEEVVYLAFPSDGHVPNRVYTVTYKRGPNQNPQGSMVKGDTVFVQNKMIFNVTPTDKS
jgi:hypothetical protein